jgi:hypothetical protein
MIINDKIKVKTTNKNIAHYRQFFNDIKSGDDIEVSSEQLPYSCKVKILVKCDICSSEKEISIFSYRRNVENYGYYSCYKCSSDKAKKTSLKLYGVESYTQTPEYLEQSRATKKEKYGDEKYVNIQKIKDTCFERYGDEIYMTTDDFKDKTKITMNNKYGVDRPLQSSEIIKKLKETNNERYGCDFVLQNSDIRNKIKIAKIKIK